MVTVKPGEVIELWLDEDKAKLGGDEDVLAGGRSWRAGDTLDLVIDQLLDLLPPKYLLPDCFFDLYFFCLVHFYIIINW